MIPTGDLNLNHLKCFQQFLVTTDENFAIVERKKTENAIKENIKTEKEK